MRFYKGGCLLVLSFFIVGALNAQGIKFQKQAWDSALTQAKTQDKLVFVDCYTTWCGPCKKMDREVFPQEKVGTFYNDNFVNVKLDMEKGVGNQIRKKYDVMAFPTFLFVDSTGKVVHRTMGYKNTNEFIKLGKTVLDPDKNLQGMRQQYQEGERSPEFIKEFLTVLEQGGYAEDYEEILTWYFHSLPKDKLLTETNFNVLIRGGHYLMGYQVNPDIVEFVIEHKEKYEQLVGKQTYTNSVLSKLQSVFLNLLTNGEKEQLNQKVSHLSSYAPLLTERAKEDALIRYHSQNDQSYKAKKKCVEYIKNYLADSPNETLYYFRNIVMGEEVKDQELYRKALQLAEQTLEKDLDTKYRLRDYYACLLYMLGEQEKAQEQAKLAKQNVPEGESNIFFFDRITSDKQNK